MYQWKLRVKELPSFSLKNRWLLEARKRLYKFLGRAKRKI